MKTLTNSITDEEPNHWQPQEMRALYYNNSITLQDQEYESFFSVYVLKLMVNAKTYIILT